MVVFQSVIECIHNTPVFTMSHSIQDGLIPRYIIKLVHIGITQFQQIFLPLDGIKPLPHIKK